MYITFNVSIVWRLKILKWQRKILRGSFRFSVPVWRVLFEEISIIYHSIQKWRVFSSFHLLQNHLFSVKKKKLSRKYSTKSTYSISQQKWDMRISTYNQRQRRETCFIGSIESSLAKRKCHCSNATLEINYWRCHGCLARDGILTGTSF